MEPAVDVSVACSLRYLDERFRSEQYAGACVSGSQGGHRRDSLLVPVSISDARAATSPGARSLVIPPTETATGAVEDFGFALLQLGEAEHRAWTGADLFGMPTDDQLRRRHYAQVERLVLRALPGALYAKAFHYTLRSTEVVGEHTRPDFTPTGVVNDVHTDYTDRSPDVLETAALGRRFGLPRPRSFCIFNLWRNLDTEQPVRQWPMAFCELASVDQSRDLVERTSRENWNIIHNVLPHPEHRWWYFPLSTSDEVLLFRQYDGRDGGGNGGDRPFYGTSGIPHTSFPVPGIPTEPGPDTPARTSLEVRVQVWFEEEGGDGGDTAAAALRAMASTESDAEIWGKYKGGVGQLRSDVNTLI